VGSGVDEVSLLPSPPHPTSAMVNKSATQVGLFSRMDIDPDEYSRDHSPTPGAINLCMNGLV
jgi:hypothetical protein